MTKEAVARQYFRDFLENTGNYEYDPDEPDEFSEEECDQIITDTFFSGGLIISWNPKKHTLMLKFIYVEDDC